MNEIESLRYDLLRAQAELAEVKIKYYNKFGDYENILAQLIRLKDENKILKDSYDMLFKVHEMALVKMSKAKNTLGGSKLP